MRNSSIGRYIVVSVAVGLVALGQAWGAQGKGPVKVFILAGQSNMEGQAVADLDGRDYNEGKGTLTALMRDPAKAPQFKHLKDAQGKWAVRGDVWVRYKRETGPLLHGPLTLGFAVYGGPHHFGPELQFGHVMGDYLDDQVLLIKTAWGGKSLYTDFRPPSSGGETGRYYRKMLAEIREALANLKTDFPGYDGGLCLVSGLERRLRARDRRAGIRAEPGELDQGRAQGPECAWAAVHYRRTDRPVGAGAGRVEHAAQGAGRSGGTARIRGQCPLRSHPRLCPQARGVTEPRPRPS